MKKSILPITLILVFVSAAAWAETAEEWRKKGVVAIEARFFPLVQSSKARGVISIGHSPFINKMS